MKIPKEREKEIKKSVDENDLIKNNEINDNQLLLNKTGKQNTKHHSHFDSGGFNKLKNGIVNKKDSIQITVMKWVSLLYVIITILLVVYEYNLSNNSYKNLIQFHSF